MLKELGLTTTIQNKVVFFCSCCWCCYWNNFLSSLHTFTLQYTLLEYCTTIKRSLASRYRCAMYTYNFVSAVIAVSVETCKFVAAANSILALAGRKNWTRKQFIVAIVVLLQCLSTTTTKTTTTTTTTTTIAKEHLHATHLTQDNKARNSPFDCDGPKLESIVSFK